MTQPVQTYIDVDAIPRHRRTDPETSVAAAKAVTESGRASRQAGMVLEALREYGPCSTAILSEPARYWLKLDRYQIARRMPELERLGLVRRTDKRDSGGIVWEVVK